MEFGEIGKFLNLKVMRRTNFQSFLPQEIVDDLNAKYLSGEFRKSFSCGDKSKIYSTTFVNYDNQEITAELEIYDNFECVFLTLISGKHIFEYFSFIKDNEVDIWHKKIDHDGKLKYDDISCVHFRNDKINCCFGPYFYTVDGHGAHERLLMQKQAEESLEA